MKPVKAIRDIFAVSTKSTADEMNRANIKAGLISTPLIALFEVVMIVITCRNIAVGASPVRVAYLQCYIVLLAATVISFALLMAWRRDIKKYRSALVWLAHIYAAVILLWAVAISFLDVGRGGSLTVYLTVLVVLACAFYLHPWAACGIFCGCTALLMVLVRTTTNHTLDITINLLVFGVFMLIVSIMRYGSKKESVFKETVIVKQNEELNQLNERLVVLSQTDMLTGLYNRRHYDEIVPGITGECARQGQEMAALMLDIDKFKKINDTYGHKTGDVCIRSVARIVLEQARKYGGTAYRFGGEEFLAVVPGCGTACAKELAEGIRGMVEATPMEGVEYPVTVSVGCYAGKPETEKDADIFVNRADRAMYCVKANGRNGVAVDG